MPNRLAAETSPYLQQHADNPVDWYPWGVEALERARAEDKPILLSIGYSACHWCHVMAHESFEDAEIASTMNQLYVNIKVDREEHPDLDQIYQSAHVMLTQRGGGWPLTVFLTPDQTPFYAGTYFPKEPRFGLPGFNDLLVRVAHAYDEQREAIAHQNVTLREALARSSEIPASTQAFSDTVLEESVEQLAAIFDWEHGGIGAAPKFPHPSELELCLRHYARTREQRALDMARRTLTSMAEGGIFDQLGGGFCRYSVDRFWTIPHFEKMLYDNGPLLRLYSDLWLIDRQPLFERVVKETAQWVMREMQSPEGGYYSSLDADSEHEEGKFYIWTPDEVRALLSTDEYAVVAPHYGLDRAPNFEGRHWHLRVVTPLAKVAQELGLDGERAQAILDSARGKLLAPREERVRPGRDEKILVSWNALMIKGMARAARVFNQPNWRDSARRAVEFVRSRLWRNGRFLATYKDGRAHLNAYLDDYAFLLDALIEMMQDEFCVADLEWAREIAAVLLAQFEDRTHGGFYFVSHDHPTLLLRPRSGHDNATPSGNGIAAIALGRLGHLVGEPRYLAAAERTLRAFYDGVGRQPHAYASLCIALEEQLVPPSLVIVRGTDGMEAWQRHFACHYLPAALTLAVPCGVSGLPPVLDKPCGAEVNAWICQGVKCLPPIGDAARAVAMVVAG